MFETSYITVNKEYFKKNLEFIKEQVKEGVQISSVVKGNAYGHGIKQFIPMALEEGVNHFSVFSAEEAREVHKITKDKAHIMIMGDVHGEGLKWAIKNNVSFFVFNFERLKNAIKYAKSLDKKARVHIELETGMNRTGFKEKETLEVIEYLKQNDCLVFEGLCTHFAGAESISNYVRVQSQIKKFNHTKKIFESEDLRPKYYHTCCSAATIRYPEMHLDMVRIGILQYGLWPSKEILIEHLSDEEKKEDPLKRLISWKTQVMSIKNVKMGEYIGYGDSYLATQAMRIAIVPVGYSHGFARSLSNQGRALIGGERVQVIGRVNMSCIALSLEHVPDAKIGDEVVLIGNQGSQSLTIASFSEISEQVNYELLTRLPSDIPREVI